MQSPRLLAVAAFLAASLCSQAAEAPTPEAVNASLTRATEYLLSISTEGGYLWRYSRDLSERWGEEKATDTQIWVQPPGTPAVGEAFLKAYQATGNDLHLRAARMAAMALVEGQLESGGWGYLVEFDPAKRDAWDYRVDADLHTNRAASLRNTTTFDDNNTQSALRFLMAYLDADTNHPPAARQPIKEALDYGLARMIEAQYPNGAWPQRWDGTRHDPKQYPVQKARIPVDWEHTWPHSAYSGYYTLNDSAQLDCMRTMLEAYHRLGDERYLDAAKRGGDFLILAQLPEPQPGWAQQYNFDMEPAWARAFEPPAICSSESAVAARTLVDMYVETGDTKYLEPIPPFIAWLKRSELEPNRWARLYELGTNKPIYGDRDGAIHYTLAEISAERQRGYGWQGSFGVPGAIAYYEAVKSKGRDSFRSLTRSNAEDRTPALGETRVAQILSQQDQEGRWLRGDWVDIRTTAINMRSLAGYLEALHSSNTH